eukprot:2555043-Pleurochrysis_carterae.AAC.2
MDLFPRRAQKVTVHTQKSKNTQACARTTCMKRRQQAIASSFRIASSLHIVSDAQQKLRPDNFCERDSQTPKWASSNDKARDAIACSCLQPVRACIPKPKGAHEQKRTHVSLSQLHKRSAMHAHASA